LSITLSAEFLSHMNPGPWKPEGGTGRRTKQAVSLLHLALSIDEAFVVGAKEETTVQ
jgi:hypothetical protein